MLTRRKLLGSGAALLGFAVLRPTLSWAAVPAAGSDSAAFYHTSLLVTARSHLSPLVAQRALYCLNAEDGDFPQQLQRLVVRRPPSLTLTSSTAIL